MNHRKTATPRQPLWTSVALLLLTAAAHAKEPSTRAAYLGTQQALLEAYRASADYLNEAWRPQFHFTPERNWMNDPNGLVYHRGEYHLFYQHNPLGPAWGHMSWGHAVSRDLVHWEHLPIAIWEEGDEMIFSGSCVVDHNNTAGFGEVDKPPMVAIYSSHRPGNQSQSLAYSLDDGRTWTKYSENPVLDLNEADFRDPKVFWHDGSQRWVMVVSLAIAKRLQFYGSDDLKQWELLSEFGPAGVETKPNWECPDLFELPVEDRSGTPTGETAWVLEVDIGDGSVAGGSGGEYFVGDFDGERFTCETTSCRSRWVDYGRDFYAPVSWDNLPESDGRRIWIGWMNNWQTHLVPTDPWRSAMSAPRALSLRRTPGGMQLVQRPVREIKQLRRDHQNGLASEIAGTELDLELKITPGSESIELSVLASDTGATIIGYDPADETLFIDRKRSGEVGFHEAFPGVHKAPLRLDGAPLRLRVLVDRSSVEVFAQDGLVTMTDRVFPNPGSNAVRLKAPDAQVERFDAWRLESIHSPRNR